MKAYAVVRKPSPVPRQVQQVFRCTPEKHHIAIENIYANHSLEIRRDSGDKPVHLIANRGQHWQISPQSKSKELNRTSLSNGKRNRIFEPRESSLNKSKMLSSIKFSQRSPGSKEQKKSVQDEIIPVVVPEVHRIEQSEQREKVQASRKLNSSQQNNQKMEEQHSPVSEQSPFLMLAKTIEPEQSNRDNRSTSHRLHRIFEKKVGFVDSDTRDQEEDLPAAKVNTPFSPYPARNHYLPSTSRQTVYPPPYQYESQTDSQRSASTIVIGCCGFCEQPQKSVGSRSNFNDFAIKNSQPINSRTIIHRTFNITQNISQKYDPPTAARPAHKQIFAQFNPEMISKKVRNPLQESTKNDKKQQRKIRVFEIQPFEPFQF